MASWDQDAVATEVLGTTEAQAYVLTADGFEPTDGSITITANNRQAPGDSGSDAAADHGAADTATPLPVAGGAGVASAFAADRCWRPRPPPAVW